MNYKVHVFKTYTSPLLQVAHSSLIIGCIFEVREEILVTIDVDLGSGDAHPVITIVLLLANLVF